MPHTPLSLLSLQPFGFDLSTSEELAETIGRLLSEEHIYRIDHYLGGEVGEEASLGVHF